MRKFLTILLYFIVFWIFLPAFMICGSGFLDVYLSGGKPLPQPFTIPGYILFIPGILLMLTSVAQFRYFGSEFPVSATPPGILIQRGLFSAWRHPIYLFSVITVSGLAMLLRSRSFLFLVLPLYISGVIIYIIFEERALLKRFGPEYVRYCNRVSLVIPRLHQWIKVLVTPFFRCWFGIRVKNKNNIPASPPFFVVAGHRNYLDPFFISYALPWPVRHISTYEMFRTATKAWIFSRLGSIPKKRYEKDPSSIREMMRALDQGHPVGVFPEGGRSWTGRMRSLKPETLEMFTRFSHIPVLPVRLEGNYHSWPRWSPGMLRARLTVSFEKVIYPGEYTGPGELEKILLERIAPRDGMEDQVTCKSRNLAGRLSLVIYRCPVCFSLDTIREKPPAALSCGNCQQVFVIDRKLWLKYTREGKEEYQCIAVIYEKIRIKTGDVLKLASRPPDAAGKPGNGEERIIYSVGCQYYQEVNESFVPAGKGTITMTPESIRISQTADEIIIPLKDIGAFTIESYCKIQIYTPVNRKLYQVVLDTESPLKWQDTVVLLMESKGLKKPLTR